MKKNIICIAILFCSIISLGQLSNLNQTDSKKVIHKLGMHAGTTSGLGVSYKALFNNKTMIQLVTLPIASKDYKYINSGISLKQKLKDYPEWDFYSYCALNYIHIRSQNYYYYSYQSDSDITNYSYTDLVNTSVGISVEYGKGEFVKWSVQAGYALYSLGTEKWQTNLSIGTRIDFALNSK